MGQVAESQSGPLRQDVEARIAEFWKAASDPGERDRTPGPALVSRETPAPYVPKRFVDATLGNFIPDPAHDSQRIALDAVKYFCGRAFANEGALLALIGPPGTGKSHLLYAAARALHRRQRFAYVRPWYRLAELLRYGGKDVTGFSVESNDVRARMFDADIVMIDELRPTAATAFDDTEVTKVVANTWDNCGALLITTNYSPLTAMMSEAAASRFTTLTITGPDRRHA